MKPTIAEARERLTETDARLLWFSSQTELEATCADIQTLLDALSQAEGVIELFASKGARWDLAHPQTGRYPISDAHQVSHRIGDFRRAATFLSSLKDRSSD